MLLHMYDGFSGNSYFRLRVTTGPPKSGVMKRTSLPWDCLGLKILLFGHHVICIPTHQGFLAASPVFLYVDLKVSPQT
jgi:hypothetical protein